MWELSKLTSRGGISTRRIFTYALTAILAAFLWTLLLAPKTHAADTAAWTGNSIVYSKGQYFSAGQAKAGDSVNLPVSSSYYTRIETVTERPLLQKAHVIYFAPGQDPGTATSAAYALYDFKDKTFSNPKNITTISINPQSAGGTYASTCSVPGGLGWIICPISVTLAGAMTWLLGVISSFMEVQPATVGDSNNALFIAWNLMRSIANVAFIIVFLIIIYSQLSNLGVTNYGIKKLLPRLIIAAVLVNVSYYICALAIDLSNVIGYSMQGFFESLRTNLFNSPTGAWNESSVWNIQSTTAFVLSSGSAAIAGSAGLLIATGGSISSAIFLLLPVLVGLILAVLVAFLILAGRQVLITVLLIISPLAFVAYLLPNTEKWFTKWRELFMTMLVFFPAFAIVFAGAQLAGGIIIQNATSINIIILGLIVQLAPLAISPLLLKLSGNFLGKIASLANTPNKLIKDRTKAWSNERAEMYRKRALGAQNLGRFSSRRAAQFFDSRARRVKERSEIYDKMADNRHLASHGGGKYNNHALHELKHAAETEHKRLEQMMERDLKLKIQATPELLKNDMEVRKLTDQVSAADAKLESIYDNVKSGADNIKTFSYGKLLADIADESSVAALDISLAAIAKQNAQRMQQGNLSEAMAKNVGTVTDALGKQTSILEYAAGSDIKNGQESALTFAVNQQREAENKLITERTQLIKHFKLDGGQRQRLAEGLNVEAKDDAGNVIYTFNGTDVFAREASIEMQMKTGSYEEIESLIALSGIDDTQSVQRRINGKPVFLDSNGKTVFNNTGNPIMVKGAKSHAQTIGDAVYANGVAGKGLFFGGRFINNISRGDVGGEAGLNFGVSMSLLDGKVKAEEIANNDAGAIRRYLEVAQAAQRGQFEPYVDTPAKRIQMLENIQAFKETAMDILDKKTETGKNAAKSTKDELEKVVALL